MSKTPIKDQAKKPVKQPRITVDEDLHAVLVQKSAGKKRNYYSRLANRLLRKAMVESQLIPDDLTSKPDLDKE